MKRYIGWGLGVVMIGGVVWLGFSITNPKPVTESVSDAATQSAATRPTLGCYSST
jgi:hypothetical protein